MRLNPKAAGLLTTLAVWAGCWTGAFVGGEAIYHGGPVKHVGTRNVKVVSSSREGIADAVLYGGLFLGFFGSFPLGDRVEDRLEKNQGEGLA